MSHLSLFRARRFWPLFWTQFFGAFNDNFLKIALTVAITFQGIQVLGVPPAQMNALAGGLFILPFFLFSATAGQLADKHEKTRIIYWVKLSEIAIMLLASFGFLRELYPLVLLSIFLMGVHSAFFGPIKYSILPQHLHQDELVSGNAYVEAGTFMAILFGIVFGGLVVQHGPWVLSLSLISLSLLGFLFSLKIPRAPSLQTDLRVEWNIIAPTFRMIRESAKNLPVFEAIKGISWFWLFGSILLSVLPVLCKEEIQSGPALLTFFLTLFSVGIAAGSVLTERLSRDHLELGLIPLGAIGMSAFTFLLGLFPPPVLPQTGILDFLSTGHGLWISFQLFLIAVSGGLFTVPLYTLMQERSDPAQRSRTIASNNILNALFMVVGSLALMAFFSWGWGTQAILLTLATLNLFGVAYAYLKIPEYFFRLLTFFLTHVFYRFRVVGHRHIPKTGAAVLISNHVSFVDWLLIMGGIKRPVRFVMDHQFAKNFLMRIVVKQSRIITISPARESVGTLTSAFKKISEALRQGDLVVIFPEGAITHDGEIAAFKNGIERILATDPVPVVPVAIQGMWGSLFSRKGGQAIKKWPRRFRARVILRVGEALSPAGVTASVLRERVLEIFNNNK